MDRIIGRWSAVWEGDDIEYATKDHGKNLRNVLQRAFKLNNEKVKLRMTEVPYIRHLLTIEGIKPGSRKLKLSRICQNQRMFPQ